MSGILNSTGAVSGILGTTVGTPAATNAADVGSGVLPVGVTGGSGLTALGTVAAGTYNATIGTSATGFGLVQNVTWMRLEANSTNNPHSNVPTWEIEHGSAANIGSQVSESGGTFTFPQTGKWSIQLNVSYSSTSDRNYIETKIFTTTNNSSYATKARDFGHINHTGSTTYHSASVDYLFDVTNTTNCKMQVGFEGQAGSDFTMIGEADTSSNSTSHVLFMRLGDT